VKVSGVAVGGLTPQEAVTAVREAFATPLRLTFAGHVLAPTPSVLGATISAQKAVERARRAAPGSVLKAAVTVRRARVAAYLGSVATRLDRKPVDARLVLRKLRPFITKDVPGRALDRAAGTRAIVAALLAGRRNRIVLHAKAIRPQTRRADFGAIVVIRRASNDLLLYDGMRLVRMFHVATGQSRYPTPLGRFEIVVKWRNPWWYPPNSPWAKGEKPIPPGPSNPLGTRWMGISAPGVGIHGTNNDSSIGYSVSHGCIRMHVPDAEWLFQHVDIGTPVFIVAA
jgi:lipoprotein-anchoring transpeptidase ErfK/SrfK